MSIDLVSLEPFQSKICRVSKVSFKLFKNTSVKTCNIYYNCCRYNKCKGLFDI